jgi:hypothetical protein
VYCVWDDIQDSLGLLMHSMKQAEKERFNDRGKNSVIE